MASKKNTNKSPLKVVNKNEIDLSAFERFEKWLRDRESWVILVPLILAAIFATLTFDVKISEGNDDAMYIEAASKYAADFTGYYYTANAPFYPMMLGIVTMYTGINLIAFKIINVVFFLLHIILFYLAFRKRIPLAVLMPAILVSAVNSYFLYYASQTYTEMMFLTFQGLFFCIFFYWYDIITALPIGKSWGSGSVVGVKKTLTVVALNESEDDRNRRMGLGKYSTAGMRSVITGTEVKAYLSIGFALFLMTFSKNIAIGMLGAVILFFLLDKNYRAIAYSVAGYLVVRVSFELLKAYVWGASNQYGSQGAILLQKDAYNPSAGQEDLSGFVTRFFENFNLYISKRLFQILGFKDPDSIQTHTILSIAVLLLVLYATIHIFHHRGDARKMAKAMAEREKNAEKAGLAGSGSDANTGGYSKLEKKNIYNSAPHAPAEYMVLPLLYVATMLGLTFLVLQTKWDQPRLVMVYVPLLFMVVLYGFFAYLSNGKGKTGVYTYIALAAVVIGSCLITSTRKSIANYPVLKKNLQGDAYYGYTPDWENYLRMSAWCADSLPKESLVACRKAPMSFVYGKGKAFFPVYTVISIDSTTNLANADSVLNYFKSNKVTHVLLANLRRNPNKVDGYIINTMHRMLEPVSRKYPQKLKLVKQIGNTEPAYLYEVKY